MTIDGFVTFLGLIVALLALASDATRKTIMLHWWAMNALSIVCSLTVLYFLFFDWVSLPCVWTDRVCRLITLGQDSGLRPERAAFIVVLVWVGLAYAILRRRTLAPRHLPRLFELLSAFAEEKRFSELCRIAEPHLRLVEETAAGRPKGISPEQQDAAIAIQRLLHKRADLVRFIALERPRLAVKMMMGHNHAVFDFADQTLSTLISTPESPLFAEIIENQNIFSTGYHFPEHNTYLHFLFGDARNANRLGAWQPIMERTIEELQQAHDGPYQAFLRKPGNRFEDVRWRDRTFVAIRFLDLMVDAAMRQGVQWHMWLYYAPHVLEPLLALYDEAGPDVDPTDEWPTRNAYLIYALFDAMTDWITAIEDLPEDSPHLVLNSLRPDHDNANIPKSAIIALGDCLRMLLLSDRVSERFKHYIADIVFRAVEKLPTKGDLAGFRKVLIASLIGGGAMGYKDHLTALHEAYADADHVLKSRIPDFGAVLMTAMGVHPPEAGCREPVMGEPEAGDR